MSNLYHGKMYSLIIDPQMKSLHELVARQIPQGTRVLDACCGTGALAVHLTSQCSEVVGVDVSPRMIDHAKREHSKRPIGNLSFAEGDVSRLHTFEDKAFAFATVVLALHEMESEIRYGVIRELSRVAKRVLVVDFGQPMPWNLAGLRNRMFEVMAGPGHFRCFREYMRTGGLPAALRELGATVEAQRPIVMGTMVLCIFSEANG